MLLAKGDIPEARYDLEQALRLLRGPEAGLVGSEAGLSQQQQPPRGPAAEQDTALEARARLALGECFRAAGGHAEALEQFELARARAGELAPRRQARGGARPGEPEVHPDVPLEGGWVEGMVAELAGHEQPWDGRRGAVRPRPRPRRPRPPSRAPAARFRGAVTKRARAQVEGPELHDPTRVVVTILPLAPQPGTAHDAAHDAAPDALASTVVSVKYAQMARAWDDAERMPPAEGALIVAEAHRRAGLALAARGLLKEARGRCALFSSSRR
jgi:hypothetical protein